MVLTRAQAAAMKTQLVATKDPEALVRQIKADAAAKRLKDAATAAQLDELVDLFEQKMTVGEDPTQALADALSAMKIGGRRRKTRKGGKKRKGGKTRKH